LGSHRWIVRQCEPFFFVTTHAFADDSAIWSQGLLAGGPVFAINLGAFMVHFQVAGSFFSETGANTAYGGKEP